MDSRTDSELVALAVGGDPDAFTELVRRYRDAAYGYSYYRTGNFEDARDLCQETFILAFRKLGQLRDADKFGAWLRRIAENLCTRWSEHRPEVPMQDLPVSQPAPESPRAALVREALFGLPDKERLAVVMHYVDGLSYGEIAGFLETSVSAVKGRLYRGREMLKREVLRMTQEAFGENKLDEEFVLKSACLAIEGARRAFDDRKDARLARRKADEALGMLEQLESTSHDVTMAKMDALWWKANLTPDVAGHNALIARMHEVGLASDDPIIVAQRLASLAGGMYWQRRWKEGDELLEQARAIAQANGDARLLAHLESVTATGARDRGDLESARRIYGRALDLHRALPSEGKLWEARSLQYREAELRAVESLPPNLNAEGLGYIDQNAGEFTVYEDRIEVFAYHTGGRRGEGWEGLPDLTHAMPTFDIGGPDAVLRLQPEVGDRWSIDIDAASNWHRQESEIESGSDTVRTSIGTYQGCLRLSKRITGVEPEGYDLCKWLFGTRIVWFAPGIGIVSTVYEPEAGSPVTTELTEFQIVGGAGYLPLEIGNWWRYRWVEGEERHGCRTDNHIRITARHQTGELLMQRYVTCTRR